MTQAIDEAKRCPVCGSADTAVLREQDTTRAHHLDHVRPFALLLGCARCEFGFRWPVLKNDDVTRHYDSHAFWGEGSLTTNAYYGGLAHVRARMIAEHTRAQSVLEIGAFNGDFLGQWKAREPGAECFATETDPQCVDHLHRAGIRVIRDPGAFGRAFELVCLFHVLEHYPDPAAFLRPIVEASLEPGGHLFIEVPHRDDLRKDLMQRSAHHVSFFNATSLRHVAESLGLGLVSCAAYGPERRATRALLTNRWTGPLIRVSAGVERRLLGRSWLQPWLSFRSYRFSEPSADGVVLRAVLRAPG